MSAKVALFQSLYFRLAAVLLLIILLVSAAQIYLAAVTFRPLIGHVDQQVNWNVAGDIAAQLQPALAKGLDRDWVESEFFRYSSINPKLEFYLLDENGGVLADFAPVGEHLKIQTVPVEPIRKFLERDVPLFPVLNTDPRDPVQESPRTFSAAAVRIGDKPGYLYLILESQPYRELIRASGMLYVNAVIGGAVGVIILLAFILELAFIRYMARSFNALSRAVVAFQAGALDSRAPVLREDEVGRLAQSFNAMAATIQAQTEELQATDSLRRKLVAVISHDLRSPLTSMKGLLETIQRNTQLNPQERDRYIELALDSVEMQKHLVADLFELSQLQAREKELQPEIFQLAEVAQDVVIKHQPEARARKQQLTFAVSGKCALVEADTILIERVIANLVSNAIKYTPEEGSISVKLAEVDGGIRLSVRDTGKGIPARDLPHIFEPFFRVAGDRLKDTGGTGLGLAIVQQILEMHNSRIEVESAEGQGSEFRFTLAAASLDAGGIRH